MVLVNSTFVTYLVYYGPCELIHCSQGFNQYFEMSVQNETFTHSVQ